MWFLTLINFIDTALEMSQALNVNFVVNSVGWFTIICRLAINCLKPNVLNIISQNLDES